MNSVVRPSLPLEVIMAPGIPEGYKELGPKDVSRPGEDIYRNSRGTWSISMNEAPVGTWTTFARKVSVRKAQPREVAPIRRAALRK